MTAAFQALAASALIAAIYSAGGERREECVTLSATETGVAAPPGEPVRSRVTLVNRCDRPLRITIELSCPGRMEWVTREVPASGEVSWTQAASFGSASCEFQARAAGW